MKNTDLEYTHLLLVKEFSFFANDYVQCIYRVKTNDIFHTMGEYMYRSMVKIESIRFTEYTQDKVDFWLKNGYEILNYKNKYV